MQNIARQRKFYVMKNFSVQLNFHHFFWPKFHTQHLISINLPICRHYVFDCRYGGWC